MEIWVVVVPHRGGKWCYWYSATPCTYVGHVVRKETCIRRGLILTVPQRACLSSVWNRPCSPLRSTEVSSCNCQLSSRNSLLLWNSQVHHCNHKSPPLEPVLSHFYPINIFKLSSKSSTLTLKIILAQFHLPSIAINYSISPISSSPKK
jgi:hypothetical protein